MANCYTCTKSILNIYWLDGKTYGYNCYKQALALKYIHLQSLVNADWSHKCIALIEVFKTKSFKDKWNIDFLNSIIAQWDNCNKLTGNQFNAIAKKLNEVEKWDYELTYMVVANGSEKSIERVREVYKSDAFNKELLIDKYYQDERLLDFLKVANTKFIDHIQNNSHRKERALKRIDRYFVQWSYLGGRKVWQWINQDRMNEMESDVVNGDLIIHNQIKFDLVNQPA